jgi:hypothetical protein
MCLRNYEVTVGDPLACSKAATVQNDIRRFGNTIVHAVEQIELAIASAPPIMNPAQATVAIVKIACEAFDS